MKGEAQTVYLSDPRCPDDESFECITVVSAEELGTFLHGVYKITKAQANAYALVVLAGVALWINVGDGHTVSIYLKGQKPSTLPLRHKVLHPSGKPYQERMEERMIEQEIAAYAAVRRASVRRAK